MRKGIIFFISFLFNLYSLPLLAKEIRFIEFYDYLIKGVEYKVMFLCTNEKGKVLPLKNIKTKTKGIISKKILKTPADTYILKFTTVKEAEKDVIVSITAKLQDGEIVKGTFKKPLIGESLPLNVKVKPQKTSVTAGKIGKIPVRVSISDENGNPVDAELKGYVTRGRLGKFQRIKIGVYVADYFLPKEKYPGLVIISVLAKKDLYEGIGYARIIINGETSLRGKTKPDSKILMYLGGEKAGETTSDKNGFFDLPLTVKPGIKEAVAKVRDPYGNVSQKKFPLEYPSSKKMGNIFVFPEKVVKDNRSFSNIFFYALERDGSALKKREFNIFAKHGRVDKVEMIDNGLWHAIYYPPEDSNTSEDTITLTYGREEVIEDVKIFNSQIPAFLRLKANKNFLPADGTDSALVEAELYSINLKPISPGELIILVDGKKIEHGSSKNSAYAEIKSPETLTREKLVVEALYRSPYGYVLSEGKTIKLGPGKPYRIILDADKTSLRSSKEEKATIIAKVMDRGENSVPGVKLEVSATKGKISQLEEKGEGIYSFQFFPPKTRRVEVSEVRVRAGRIKERIKLIILPKLYLVGAGLEIGYLYNFRDISSFYPVFSVVFRLPLFKRRFFTGLQAGYFNFSTEKNTITDSDNGVKFTGSGDFVPIFLKLQYHLPLAEFWGFNFGGGLGINLSNIRLSTGYDSPILHNRSLNFSTFIHIGAEYRIGPGRIIGGVNYTYANLSKKEGLLTTSGYAGGFSFSAGYLFTF